MITGRNLGVACPECGTTDGWICECQLDPQISLGVPVFALDRHEDETGVSGPGRVAYGVVFPNGKTVLAWVVPDKPQSVAVYDSIHDMFAIHVGPHRGKTELTWLFLPQMLESWQERFRRGRE